MGLVPLREYETDWYFCLVFLGFYDLQFHIGK